MARVEWVKARLENWALWHERGRGGGLGWATQSVLLSLGVGSSNTREVRLPVDEIEASETDKAVSGLVKTHPHLHRTLTLYYLDGLGIVETARRMSRAESTIKAQLAQADHLLAAVFAEWKRVKELKAKELQAALQAARPARLSRPVVPLPPLPRKRAAKR